VKCTTLPLSPIFVLGFDRCRSWFDSGCFAST
jgi:hypothetical protein